MFILFLVHMCGQHKVAFTAPLIAILVALPSVYWTWPGLMSKEADWANQPSSTDRQTDRQTDPVSQNTTALTDSDGVTEAVDSSLEILSEMRQVKL